MNHVIFMLNSSEYNVNFEWVNSHELKMPVYIGRDVKFKAIEYHSKGGN